MQANLKIKAIAIFLFSFVCFLRSLCAQGVFPFPGEVSSDNINVRSDSAVSSEVICVLHRGTEVEVFLELYDWYKIKLPKSAPAFIKKNLVTFIDSKIAKVSKDRVNIRLSPNESSPIIGKVNQGEIISILKDEGQWYRIEPLDNCFGWVHKKFVRKISALVKMEDNKLAQEAKEESKIASQALPSDKNMITVEGIIRPKVMKRIATHKLLTIDNKIFLLRGDPETLNAFNYHNVRVNGKLAESYQQKYSIIEIVKIEKIE